MSVKAEEGFQTCLEMLIEHNKKINLTAITECKDIILKHFVDSIAAASLLKMGARVCDIGAGAGFPSIPLKLVREDLSFTLLEATGKKVSFLRELIAELGLSGVEARHLRAEDAGRGAYRGEFDAVVARAVAGTSVLLEYAMPLLKPGGVLIAYKTNSDAALKGCQNAIKRLNTRIKDRRDYVLYGTDMKRALLVFEKIGETPAKYPRGGGKERSKPL